MKSDSKVRLMTIAELADLLRISKRSAYRVARQMLHVEIGGRLLVPEPAVETFIQLHIKEPSVWGISESAARPTTG